MKKLCLDLDQLAVETFDTRASAEPPAGTVRGAEQQVCPCCCCCPCCCTVGESCGGTCGETCLTCPRTCGHTCASCEYSCAGTCDQSCEETCTCPYTYEGWRVDTNMSCVIACPVCA